MNKNISRLFQYTFVSILNAAISLITMMVLTRVLSKQFLGNFNLFITASSTLMSIICFGFDSSYIRFFYEPPNNLNSKQLAWYCIFPTIILFLLSDCLIICFRNTDFINVLIGGKGTLIACLFIISVISQFIFRYFTVFFRMKDKVISFSAITLLFVLISKSIIIILFRFNQSYAFILSITNILLVLLMLFFLIRNFSDFIEFTPIKINKYKTISRVALFCAPNFAVVYLISYIPQTLIKKYLDDGTLGVFTGLLLFVNAVQALSTGFTTFWSPYMYKNYKEKNEEIKMVHDIVMLALIVCLAGILIFHKVLYCFIGSQFRLNQEILGIILICPLINIAVETTCYGIAIENRNEITLSIYLLTLIVNVLLCFLLIKKYSLLGVAIASALSSDLKFVLMTLIGQRMYKSITDMKKTFFMFFIINVLAVVFFVLYEHFSVMIVICLAACLISIVCNINVVKYIYSLIKKKKKE